MTEEEFDKKWNSIYQRRVEDSHYQPAPETRERLKALETTQSFMVQEITEIKDLVKGLDKKLDNVIECKADRSEVETLKETVEDLKTWKIKLMVVGSIILFIVTFLKDEILSFFNHL